MKKQKQEAKKRQGARSDLTSGKKFPQVEKGRPSEHAVKVDLVEKVPQSKKEAKKRQIRKPESVLEIIPKPESVTQKVGEQPFHAPKEAGNHLIEQYCDCDERCTICGRKRKECRNE